MRTETQLHDALQRWPSSNWGLATGVISGVWALDYDPAGTAPGEAEAVQSVLAACWATATWVQRTGGGGLHFLFALPPDFVPNNGSGTLPKGFDVRGARRGESGGGQIVLAPSVTAKGAYEVLADRQPAAAPPGVLDAVRPAPPRERGTGRTTLGIEAAPGAISAYVTAAINGELAELRACWVQRNQRAWKAAARCVELINTGQVDGEAVYAAWWAAGLAHPDHNVRVPDVELLRVWASAERHVGDRPAALSGVGGMPGWAGGDAIHFAGAPSAPPLGGGLGADIGMSHYPQGAPGAAGDGRYIGVASHDSAGQGHDIDPVGALLAEMLDVDQLRAIVPPQPLINGVLDLDTTAWLIGESGSYKSFVALDLAAHVALGRPWRGHDVHQGEVVYIVAEGARGMRLRVDAWEREHGALKGVRFLPRPVQAADRAGWDVLAEACRRLRPAMVIIDTQARVTLGLEENSNTDMGQYIAAVDTIRRATGACVLTVHHMGRGGRNARGASALDGAQDAELSIKKVGQYAIELHMDKQKDQAEAPPIPLRLRRSEGGTDPLTGRDLSSLVLDHAAVPVLGEPGETKVDIGRRRALALYKVIAEHREAGGEGLLRAEIRKLFCDLPEIGALSAAMQRSAWHRAWALLVSRGRVMREPGSQRLGVFPPPDGAGDGLLTMNTGGPDDAPPDGWAILWPESDRPQAVDKTCG